MLPEAIRQFGPMVFAENFGYTPTMEPDRFAHHGDAFAAALAEFQAEPRFRMLFENGAGHEVQGATQHRYEATAPTFPPPGIETRRWYLATDAGLVEEAPGDEGVEQYVDDPEPGPEGYATEFLDNLSPVHPGP